jgi:multisubunit Na+/H+ antiporter MnhB subunit
MTHNQPLFLFLVIFMILAYRWFSQRRDGPPGIRHITGYGVAFCVVSLNLWFLTRFEDILNSFPNPHETSIFATPWLWVSALCVGIALLLVSFFTRVKHDRAA